MTRIAKWGRALRRQLPWVALACAAALAAGCGPDLFAGGGSGTETTNGLTGRVRLPDGKPAAGARLRLRREDFLPGSPATVTGKLRDRADTVAGADGGFSFPDLAPGPYLLSVAYDSDRGLALRATLPDAPGAAVNLGAPAVQPLGGLAGKVERANLPGDSLWVEVYGLDLRVPCGPDGSFRLDGLPPGRYRLRVAAADTARSGVLRLDSVAVAPAKDTALGTVFLPVDYWVDSSLVAAFLARQGLPASRYRAVIGLLDGRIRKLNLSDMGITTLDSSIEQVQNLYALDLSGNPLTGLPPQLARISSLTHLYLNRVPMDSLWPEALACKGLKTLGLARTGLRRLPDSLPSLRLLEAVILDSNGLDSVPEPVLRVDSLRILSLAGNPIRSAPAGLFAHRGLFSLSFQDDSLEALPDAFGDLPYLENLFLGGNRLRALPASLARLPALKTLGLERNPLAALPDSLGGLSTLAYLNVSGDSLAALPASAVRLRPSQLVVAGNRLCAEPAAVSAWLDAYAPGWRALQACP